MSVKLNKITALIVAVLTLFSSFSFLFPLAYYVSAEENVTYIGDEEAFRAALEGNGGSYTLSDDIVLTVTEYEEYRYIVTGTVLLDLNGHSVKIKNTANLTDYTNDSTLIKIENKGKLTISDSSPNEIGSLSYEGGIHLYSESEDYADFKVVTGRHLIFVADGASLTVDGGNFIAGNTEKEWLHRAAGVIDKKFEYYTGFAENTVCGTVITASSNSNVTINGGSFEANGRKRQNILPNLKGWNEERPASVCIRAEAKANVTVNDGSFVGAHGADVFSLDVKSKSSVKAGVFETTPSINERLADYMDFAAVNVSTYYGKLNLPTVFIPGNSRTSLYQNGAPLEKTADAIDGAPVYLTPTTADFATITSSFTSGTYTPGGKGTLSSGYTKYFSDGSTVNYSWYAIAINGKVTPVPNSNSTSLDLSKLASKGISLSLGSKYSFACVITETYKDYVLTTVSRTISFNTTNKYILAAISLTPSSIDDNNHYHSGSAPTFKVPSNANYQIDSISWYERNSTESIASPATLKENSTYFVVFELSSKGSYLFTYDTQIAFLPGATSASIAPSIDGKTATVSAWITTACSHSATEYIIDDVAHNKLCTVCGHVISSGSHTYTDWSQDGESGEMIPMSRSCTACSHKEGSAVFAPIENEKTPIYEIKIDFGKPTEGSKPVAPTIASTPDSTKVVIDSYFWKTLSNADFTKFEAEKKYALTVVYKLADPDNYVFSESTISSSLHYSTAQHTLSEDKTELTVVYTVSTIAVGGREIYLPSIKAGQELTKANITLWGTSTAYWYKDGKIIGYTELTNNSDTRVHYDYDENDGIDFLTHVIEENSVYYVRIGWHITKGNQIAKDQIKLTNAVPLSRSIVGGEFGFVTAYFIPFTADKYVRSVKVTGIVEPSAGASPKTTGATVDASCTVKSISFSSGSSSVSKFACGKEYTVKVTLAPKEGYTFALVSASINGHGATVTESGGNIILTYTFKAIHHNIDNRNAAVTLPSCTQNGSIVGKCKSCSATAEIPLDTLGHSLVEIIGVAATCEKDGQTTHFLCITCHKLYSDDKAINETNKEATVIPMDSTNHIGVTLTAHDGNDHFTVCVGCAAAEGTVAHEYGDSQLDADGNSYYTCQCGHSIPASGPKQPEFVIGGIEDTFTPPSNGGFDFGGFSFKTLKLLLILIIIFIALLIGAIITISVILIITRDRSGNQLLPDEIEAKTQLSSTDNK